jgi:membrane-bound metal-dependent hydrolase YbcI (DUF457 family)
VPSFLPHAVGPILVALAFFPVPRRTVLMLAPFAFAPDLDYLLQSEHRALTHSLFVPLLLLAAVVVLWLRRDRAAGFWEFATRPGAPVVLTLASYFVAGHILMDVFAGGVVLLWPVLDLNVFLGFEILLDTANNTFTPAGEAGTSEGAPALSPLYPWVSTVDTAVAAFLAACLLGWASLRVWRRARGLEPPKPVIVRRVARPIHKP